jgi:hypothetical protein
MEQRKATQGGADGVFRQAVGLTQNLKHLLNVHPLLIPERTLQL